MPVSATIPSILPASSLLRLKSLEDRITYKYSQDRIDQGLDQDGNEIEDPTLHQFRQGENLAEYHANMQWLLRLLAKLEGAAPPQEDDDEEELDNNRDEGADMGSVAKKTAVRTKETPQEAEYRLQHEILTERVASCLTHFCGRAASGAMTRTWTYKTTPPQSLHIHDPSFIGGDVGFKTFGSAYLLSKHIVHGDIPQLEPWTSSSPSSLAASLPLPKTLELGSGTGLVGFAATLVSNPQGPRVILSDYHPNVISTLRRNSSLNHLDLRCDIRLLDWRNILQRRKRRQNAWQYNSDTSNGKQPTTEYDNVTKTPSAVEADSDQEISEQDRMDLILGAEIVYDHGHAELVAHVVDEYLKRDLISEDIAIPLARRRPAFHIMFPIRKTHADVIADFDFWMDKIGLVDCRQAKEWGREDGETTFLYHWREYVRKEHLDRNVA
ncbi:hypothetical protein BC939DRAFT_461524 [Gamsiella multidivaricata]|uniref:uncharacterized protein n=1 Tax=Gamsiella multidivaricata TaxID=101098 RepID=UPI0022212441|nr:uncharacterized protein BC939DRAFT_461524 [Gamsiella multidivaricata]KAG0368102.1 hypothetical protein BGZ54_002673 [Gamsiella multidivaricata]KAI7818944.1 hypothetical protein BC939DRAFT_461524 [Gamsiella multidivaricata]